MDSHTLWHTSDKRVAVKSLISFCRMDGYPPSGPDDSTCSTIKRMPQAQCRGALAGMQPFKYTTVHEASMPYPRALRLACT